MTNFLKIDKTLLEDEKLNSTDVIIIALIQEDLETKGECIINNKTFAKMCGCSESTIKRAIDKLVKGGYLLKQTIIIPGGGKKRFLYLSEQ